DRVDLEQFWETAPEVAWCLYQLSPLPPEDIFGVASEHPHGWCYFREHTAKVTRSLLDAHQGQNSDAIPKQRSTLPGLIQERRFFLQNELPEWLDMSEPPRPDFHHDSDDAA
ncbi:unnamed protein product, partial [Symbiodinium sp. CCMP2592]